MGGGYGRMIFPINSGQTESSFVDGTDYDYDARNSPTIKGKAYHDVSVNPLTTTTNLISENISSSAGLLDSAIFTEIRKSPHGGSISNDNAGLIGNRLLPTNTSLTSYAVNRDETHPFKVKIYDSTVNLPEINRRFIYSTSDTPATDETGIDIENYDYFILLNPDINSVGTNTIRPHFAKITRIVAFDDFGDGVEFSPEYPTSVPINTKLWIFKGPAKTDTDVVAVSYGLRGDIDAVNTTKYDEVSVVSRPTFYFYNDRLDENDHLDYATKYTLTSLRWYGYPHTISITSHDAHAIYDIGSATKYFEVSSLSIWNKLTEGQSIFTSSGNWLGNIESIYSTVGNEYRFYLDYARRLIADGSDNVRIGKTIQNVVFRTEYKFNSNIENLGEFRLDATLVDANKNDDDDDSNFDCVRWHKAFPNMHRHTGDLVAVSASTLDGNLIGPSKYLTFEKSQLKNDMVPNIQDIILNSPRNRITKLLTFSALDMSGIQHLKVKNNEKVVVRNAIYNSSFQMKKIVGKVDKLVVGSDHSFVIRELEDKDIDLNSFLNTDSIVLIDDYYYVINTITTKSNSSPLEQAFTIKRKRATTAKIWTDTSQGETVSKKTMFISPYTGVLNFEFVADTKVNTNQALVNSAGQATGEYRITLNGNTIEKKNTKLYNSRFTVGKYNSHVNEIDYVDKDNKYMKLKNDTRKFYQSTGRLMHYYNLGENYVLHEEVFTGLVEEANYDFSNGSPIFKVAARDDISILLMQVLDKNMNHSKDIAMSSFTKLTASNTFTPVEDMTISANIINKDDNASLFPTDIIFNIVTTSDDKFVGVVKSVENNYFGQNDRIVLFNNAPSNVLGDYASIKYCKTFDISDANKITGLKAIQSNAAHDKRLSDYTSLSEKGIVFDKSLDLTYDGAGIASSDFTLTSLGLTSNIGDYSTSRGLGYDISSPTAISSEDSEFAFNIGNENGVTNTKSNVTLLNSETFDIVKINEQKEGLTKLEIAPIFPVILGRIDTNTSDTRAEDGVGDGAKIYTVNSNINTGGYLHRLQNTHSSIYGSEDTIRYWDFQKLEPGNLTRTYDSIYNEGIRPQKIQGYAIGYGVYGGGVTYTPDPTIDNKPLAGSNTLEGWDYLSNFYGSSPLIKSYAHNNSITDVGHDLETDIRYSSFEQIDPRTIPYEFFATGDILPSSKLVWNNLSFHTINFDSLGIILEGESFTINSVSHQHYTGTTKQTEKIENMFENTTIQSASKSASQGGASQIMTTDKIKRWGVARLVEATFDWHFNPVDFESLKPADEIPRVKYFDYVMMAKPTVDSGTITVSNQTVVTGNTVADTVGDVFYNVNDIGTNSDEGDEIVLDNNLNGFIAARKITGPTYTTAGNGSVSADWLANNLITISSAYGSGASDILRFDGTSDHYGVESFKLYSSPSFQINNLATTTDSTFRNDRKDGTYSIPFTNVYIMRGNITTENFAYGGLKYLSGLSQVKFDPHNIILPLIPAVRESPTNMQDRHYSPFHHSYDWFSATDQNMLHMSRVVCGLMERTYSTGVNISFDDKFSMGLSATNSPYFSHIYGGCIGLFKDLSNAISGEATDISLTSSKLTGVADSTYSAYATNHNNVLEDQHSRNLMVSKSNLAMRGTKSIAHLLQDDEGYFSSLNAFSSNAFTNRRDFHSSGEQVAIGKAYSAQFIVKPVFDLTATNGITHSNLGKTITFVLNHTSQHSWLSYMPDLTGYYLVSEKLTTDRHIHDTIEGGHPKIIAKITGHTILPAPGTSAIETHNITLDTDLTTGSKLTTNGDRYRLMRLSETTFDDVADKIEINVMKSSSAKHFKTGVKGNSTSDNFQEGIYSMYLLLDIDRTNTYLERRTIAEIGDSFSTGQTIDTYISDGFNSQRKTLSVKKLRLKGNTTTTEAGLSFTYEGKLNGNGVVSFGEIISVQLNKRPKLKNPIKCHIGNTFSVGSQIEREIQNIVTEAGLEYDPSESFSEKTGNVVNTISSSVITCVDTVKNIVANDILYSHEGHLVGKVLSVSGSNITFTKLYYTPLKYDELIRIERKTFVTNLRLNNLDVYSALNTLAIKRGLDYSLRNGVFRTRNINDVHSMRRYSLSALEDYDNIISIKSDKSLFDVYNKVIIIGDGVKLHMSRSTNINPKLNMRHKALRYTDLSINTEAEARIRASELLDIHSEETIKVELKLFREGFELLEAGDILGLSFPTSGIPSDDYIVFEIENVLVGELSLIVGTFDKTIAERLVEIQSEETKNTIVAATQDTESIATGIIEYEDFPNLKSISVKYTITQSAENSNMGFDDLVGFTEIVGFEESSQTTDTYDSENWTDVAEGLE
tara:strand:- start:10783 stop:17742 length:6960 start_codon:yes stop_codon:yes gene_type:complete